MDNTTPFKMLPSTGRNIIIFSDGTGQAGGLVPDEPRSNVYKLFRATRCGPDTKIDPDKQLAFYDPGLGSKSAAGEIKLGWLRWSYNLLSSATGLGITLNVIDCYAALLYLWRPGDRIYLFGFSRGAYTVRCLGGVLGLCGIPTVIADDKPFLRDPETIRRIATEAVKRVYRHGSGASDDPTPKGKTRKDRLGEQRKHLGEQFRRKYKSEGANGANAVPHFVGVWDTVAAVGLTPPAWATVRIMAAALLLLGAAAVAWIKVHAINLQFLGWFTGAALAIGLIGYLSYIVLRVKFVTDLPGYKWYQTLHLTSFKMAFFDRTLNKNVRYARHALAIDERRADFDRVPWVNDGQPPNREVEEGAWFHQYWFAGNHSDIGGSYAENESRLSDLALGWMSNEARRAGLLINDDLLNLFGRPNGPQHDECRVGISFLGMKFKWREKARKVVDNATVHWSVLKRFEEPLVLIYDEEKPYRPDLLRTHQQFASIFESEASASITENSTPTRSAFGKMPDLQPKGPPWWEKLKRWWLLPVVLFFLAWFTGNAFDIWDRVAVPTWRWFSPSYSAELAIRPSLINLDQAATLSVEIKRNDIAWTDAASCTWSINGKPIAKNHCETWVYTPDPNFIPKGITESAYKLVVSVSKIDGTSQVETEPKTLIIRGINTPQIQAEATNLYLGENTALLVVINGLPPGVMPTCAWKATVGKMDVLDSNSCSAHYFAPPDLPIGSVVEPVTIAATVAVGSLTSIQSETAVVKVSVPEESVYQYVVEASRRMTLNNENGTIPFDVARQQIRDNIDRLKGDSGYGGIQIAGGAPASIACKHLGGALLPLGPLGGVTYENLALALDTVDLSGDGVPLLSAWRKVVAEYHRFSAGNQFRNPRFFLITLVTGGDTCEGEDPATHLQQLGLTIEKNELRELLFQDRLITLTIATDSNAWWNTLSSSQYAEDRNVLFLPWTTSDLRDLLGWIGRLGSSDVKEVIIACAGLDKLLVQQKDEIGRGKMSRICEAIQISRGK